ncbi:site-specific integrase [Staphylococcus casei]|uniref:Tyr recombinase domain-containing protein n=1 Tax=Staphylococcus equorum TaxID=246432 RepID=A0AAP7IC21_9STAP|nr:MULTISPECIES: site-specific integrase [Staphylococcus]OEK55061.1 hypothetical protein ASS94_09055 [Staphylococcus equorum]PNZ60904.1 site-specific integrase [Staphylococcus casei]WJE87393.1 site-specific integrase [Staphylococcus casei]
MWSEQFKDKNGKVKHRYYEKYKDPYTDKWRRVSVVMNKNSKASQKEAVLQLEKKINDKLTKQSSLGTASLTVHTAIDKWFEHYKLYSGSKASTLKTKKAKVKSVKSVFPSDLLVDKLDYNISQKYLDEYYKLGFSQIVNSDVLGIFKHSIMHMKKIYNLNNTEYLNDLVVPKKVKTKESIVKERENYLEVSELKQILKYLNHKVSTTNYNRSKRFYFFASLIIEFQSLTGLRIGELLAIKESDIDFTNKKLSVNGTMFWAKSDEGFGSKETTKTDKSYRTINLTKRCCDILNRAITENKKLRLQKVKRNDRGFVFSAVSGNPIQSTRINDVLSECVDAVKLDKHVTTHTLRHTHISMLAEMGMSLKVIMNRVGHSNPNTTLKVYTHVTDKMEKSMISKLEKLKIV